MAIMEKVRDVETPDIKLEMPKVDVDKAKASMTKATSSMRDAVYHRLPRQANDGVTDNIPSKIPFLVGGLLAGLSIGYFVATSDWFQPMVKDTVGQWRQRLNQMRNQPTTDDFGGTVTYTEMTAVMEDTTPTDTLSDSDPDMQRRSEQSYAI